MAVSISGLRRNIKNVAHNYTDAQVNKVTTSGPSLKIAEVTNIGPILKTGKIPFSSPISKISCKGPSFKIEE